MEDLRETLIRTAKLIEIESQTDEGEWITRTFGNEAAAVEFERKMAKAEVSTRRK